MEDNLKIKLITDNLKKKYKNGRRPQKNYYWKMTSKKKWKTTSKKGKQPNKNIWKTTSKKYKWKTT